MEKTNPESTGPETPRGILWKIFLWDLFPLWHNGPWSRKVLHLSVRPGTQWREPQGWRGHIQFSGEEAAAQGICITCPGSSL